MEPDYVLLPAVSPPPTPSNPFDLHVDQFINIISRKPSANREQDDDDDDDDPNHPKLADGSKIRKKHRPRVVLSCEHLRLLHHPSLLSSAHPNLQALLASDVKRNAIREYPVQPASKEAIQSPVKFQL